MIKRYIFAGLIIATMASFAADNEGYPANDYPHSVESLITPTTNTSDLNKTLKTSYSLANYLSANDRYKPGKLQSPHKWIIDLTNQITKVKEVESRHFMHSWKNLATADNIGEFGPSILFNPRNKEPYMLYSDSNATTIVRFNGKKLITIGEPGFSDADIYNDFINKALIMLSNTNELYLIYYYYSSLSDNTDDYGITIMKFNGNKWVPIGEFKHAINWSIAFNNTKDGVPYLAYNDNQYPKNPQIKLIKFSNNNWQPVISRPIKGHNPIIAFNDLTNQLYMVYQPKELDTSVVTLNGRKWVQLGSTIHYADNVSLAFHPDTHQPYLAYINPYKLVDVTVTKFNGSNWESVGEIDFDHETHVGKIKINDIKIYFNPINKQPYLAYEYYGFHTEITANIKKFDGNKWLDIAKPLKLGHCSQLPSLAFSNNGQPYLAYYSSSVDFNFDCQAFLATLN